MIVRAELRGRGTQANRKLGFAEIEIEIPDNAATFEHNGRTFRIVAMQNVRLGPAQEMTAKRVVGVEIFRRTRVVERLGNVPDVEFFGRKASGSNPETPPEAPAPPVVVAAAETPKPKPARKQAEVHGAG
jgi:hypothetical protein